MQVIQTLESINVNTDDISLFCYFKSLIVKNFSKVIGRKNKILSFFTEDEIPQRRYFLKVLNKQFNKNQGCDIENLSQAHFKTFKLNFDQTNTIKPMIYIDIDFNDKAILMKFSMYEKLFIAYIKNFFKNHKISFNQTNSLLMLECVDDVSLELFESFADESEHLKYYVNFNIDSAKYKNFASCLNKPSQLSQNWKFNALAKLFSNYFKTLDCSPSNDLHQIRQRYLSLAKLYHPDFYEQKCPKQKQKAREKFEQIQIAYDNLKALYKNNA